MLVISNNLNLGFPGSHRLLTCVSPPGHPVLRLTMKTCTNPECGKRKPLSEFYRDKQKKDGYTSRCKVCVTAQQASWYKTNRQKIIVHTRLYRASHREERAANARLYRERHGEEIKACNRDYRANHRKRIAAYWRDYYRTHAKEEGARSKVRRAKMTGKLVAEPCEQCGATKTEAHHDDYDKPLDIRWLCSGCHKRLHVALKEKK